MVIFYGTRDIDKIVARNIPQKVCNHCNNTEDMQITRSSTWFTLFFIPLIPYINTYFLSCPKCGNICTQLEKNEAKELIARSKQ